MRVFAWIATFGLMLLIARITSLQDFGRYGTAIAWSLVLAALAPVGLEFVCLRHIPIEIAAAKLGHAKALLVKAKVTTLAVSIVLTALVSLLAVLRVAGLEPNLIPMLWAIPALALLSVERQVQFALLRPVLANVFDGIIRPLVCAAILAALWMMMCGSLNLLQLGLAILISSWAAACMALLSPHTPLDGTCNASRPTINQGKYRREGIRMMAVAFLVILLSQSGILSLGILSSDSNVGLYTAALRLSTLLTFPVVAMQAVVAGRMAQLYATDSHDQLADLNVWISRTAILLTVPLAIPLLLFPSFFLQAFGSDYAAARASVLVLVPAQLFSSWTGATSYLLTMTGQQGVLCRIGALSLVLNFTLMILLIPYFHATGAAIAMAASLILFNGGIITYLARQHGRLFLWLSWRT